MIGQLGFACVIIALVLAMAQAIVPLYGAQKGLSQLIQMGRLLARAQFFFVLLSFVLLVNLFLSNDFSIQYVWRNSSTVLPWYYRITATWGSHEGSLLLWCLILAGWTLVVSIYSKHLPEPFVARVLSVMGFISVGFLIYIVALSDPFAPLVDLDNQLKPLLLATEGRGLNPLLQDIGMIIHPPMLYLGYVGFCVAFSFAIAALIEGRLDAVWARWSRPWINMAWVFLTLGIMLGSWWAYYELGWGGWWFWDPVENASFMPWLVGTALVHSLAVTEKRSAFHTWTLMLAIIAFSLSLLGTFLVRSGILNSVHAFGNAPGRGIYMLVFLVLVIGIPLYLYSKRANRIKSVGRFEVLSRESFMLVNNVGFVVIAACVLLGTLYPIIYSTFIKGSMSVGEPYFNLVFLIFMLPLAALAVVAPQVKWKKDKAENILKKLSIPFVLTIIAVLLFLFQFDISIGVSLVLGLVVWIFINGFDPLLYRMRKKKSILLGFKSLPAAGYGMMIAHLGIGVFILGACSVSNFNISKDVVLKVGEHFQIKQYQFHLNSVQWKTGANYYAFSADVSLMRDGVEVTRLYPQKRSYFRQAANLMTEAGIDPKLQRDMFITLIEPLDRAILGVLKTNRFEVDEAFIKTVNDQIKSQGWIFRLQYKPFVRLIWLGAIFMALGGLIAASDKRYRKVKSKPKKGVSA